MRQADMVWCPHQVGLTYNDIYIQVRKFQSYASFNSFACHVPTTRNFLVIFSNNQAPISLNLIEENIFNFEAQKQYINIHFSAGLEEFIFINLFGFKNNNTANSIITPKEQSLKKLYINQISCGNYIYSKQEFTLN